MKRNNKKGFTIVELVIVIAVIAVLAAVLIPTFSSIVRKAKISADTQLAKNLNTSLAAAQEIDGMPEDFDEALAILKADGYIIANINPTTEGWFYVWESSTNQILLVEGVDKGFSVYYSSKAGYPGICNTWHFAISDATATGEVKEAIKGMDLPEGGQPVVKNTVVDVADLKGLLTMNGAEIYMDESAVLTKDSLLTFTDNVTVTVNLGDAQLTSNGPIKTGDSVNTFPIDVQQGTVTINGGIVGASGDATDLDGKKFGSPINSKAGSTVIINDTEFIASTSISDETLGGLQFAGKATLNNVKANTYYYAYGKGEVVLNNCQNSVNNDVAIWVTNTLKDGATSYHPDTKLTVNGGSYTGRIDLSHYATVSLTGGTIEIKAGEFNSLGGAMFGIHSKESSVGGAARIVLNGGTFNGKVLGSAELNTVAQVKALCVGGGVLAGQEYNVVKDGTSFIITRA